MRDVEREHTQDAKIGFVILTWNSENCISSCLSSIFSLDPARLSGKVIVVDNGSTDQTVERIYKAVDDCGKQSGFTCELRKLDKNYGTTISRNIGLKSLMAENIDYICVLDSDTVVNSDAILTLTHVLDADPSVGIVGPRMLDKNRVYQHSGRSLPTLTEKALKVLPSKGLHEMGTRMEVSIPDEGTGCVPVGYLLSACWMMRKELPAEIGPLDERIFYAPEDVDYCIRCQKAGYSVQYCYDAEIIHEWQRLSRKKLFSKHNYEHIKGLAYLFWKHRYAFRTSGLDRVFARRRNQKKMESIAL